MKKNEIVLPIIAISVVIAVIFLQITIKEFPNSKTEASELSNFEKVETISKVEITEPAREVMNSVINIVKKEVKISFLGDCMLASLHGQKVQGNMNWYLDNYPFTYFFEDVIQYIGNDDFTIANCENVFTDTAITPITKDHTPAYWFRSAMKNAGVFSVNSIEAVSIANNHINDYGNQGKTDTKKALENVGVIWGDNDKVISLEKDGIKIGVLCVGFWRGSQTNWIVNKIKSIEDTTDIQIVFFHGGKEGTHVPEDWKKAGCHAFVDAGADLVVGGHPHVLQPYEEYKGVDIIYSLGNFCYGGSNSPQNRTIILQETFVFENDKFVSAKEEFIPCYVYTGKTNNWKPSPIYEEDEKNAVLNFMYGKSYSPF